MPLVTLPVAVQTVAVLKDPGLARADGVLGAALDDWLQHRVEDGKGHVGCPAQVLQIGLLRLEYLFAGDDLVVLLKDGPLGREVLLRLLNLALQGGLAALQGGDLLGQSGGVRRLWGGGRPVPPAIAAATVVITGVEFGG